MTIFVMPVEDAIACTLSGALGTVVRPRMQGRYTEAGQDFAYNFLIAKGLDAVMRVNS